MNMILQIKKIQSILSSHKILLVILLVTSLAYANVLSNDFFGDDWFFIVTWPNNPHYGSLSAIFSGDLPPQVSGVYRPLRSLLYIVTQYLLGQNPFYYHIVSIFLHLAITFEVYILSRLLKINKQWSLIGTLLFGLHPTHTEAVSYIASSFDLLSPLFLLATMISYISLKSKNFPLLMATLSILSGEFGVIIPLLVTSYVVLVKKVNISKAIKQTSGFWIITGIYWLMRIQLGITSRGIHVEGNPLWTYLVSLKALVKYFLLLLFPQNLSLLHEIPNGIRVSDVPILVQTAMLNQSINEIWSFVGMLIIISLGFGAFIAHKNNKNSLSWVCIFILISLLPLMNFLPTSSLMSERYIYLTSVGWIVLLAKLGNIFLKNQSQKFVWIVAIGISVWYGTITYRRNQVWANDMTMWVSTAEQQDQNAWAQFKAGEELYKADQKDKAKQYLTKAISIHPTFSYPHYFLGLIEEGKGASESALYHYQQAATGDPYNPQFEQALINFQ